MFSYSVWKCPNAFSLSWNACRLTRSCSLALPAPFCGFLKYVKMKGLLVALNWPTAVWNSSSVKRPTLVWNSITKMSQPRISLSYSSCKRVCDSVSRKSSHTMRSR